MMIKIKSPALAVANGKQVGEAVNVPDNNGVPLDKYWRSRLKDAEIDGCCEVVTSNSTPAAPKPPQVKEGKK